MKSYKILLFAPVVFALAACSSAPTIKSPTETLKIFIEASKKKDVETIKKSLSKGSMDLVEKSAKEQNVPVDEMLQKESGAPIKEMPETRDEKIEGDRASVEIKNKTTGEYEMIPFVKEDGVWKIALDVFMRDMMKKMTDNMKPPAADSSPDTNRSAASPNNETKPSANKKN